MTLISRVLRIAGNAVKTGHHFTKKIDNELQEVLQVIQPGPFKSQPWRWNHVPHEKASINKALQNWKDAVSRYPTPLPLTTPFMTELRSEITQLFIPHANEETNLLEQKSTEKYFKSIGIRLEDLTELRVIHVAGTKGKGSTCVMVENILRRCGYSTGLFTSPHLCDVCERVRINGVMIERVRFHQEMEWVYSRLKSLESHSIPMPRFFRLLTFVCFRIFLQEKLDVVILETGIGGRLDPTNFIPEPLVCGISSIGFDHMDLLGQSLREIASEKAGILKPSCLGFTVPQFNEAMETLEQRAAEVGVELIKIDQFAPFKNFDAIRNASVVTGYQSTNAQLAVHLARAFETRSWTHSIHSSLKDRHTEYLKRMEVFKRKHELPQEYVDALSEFEWPGRAQTIHDEMFKNLSFYLDGAHTTESLPIAVSWFLSTISSHPCPDGCSSSINFLLFYCLGDRNAETLLQSLYRRIKSGNFEFDHVFFAPLISARAGKSPIRSHPSDFSYEKNQLMTWKSVLEKNKIQYQFQRKELANSTLKSDFLWIESHSSKVQRINADIFPSLSTAIGWFRNFAKENIKSEVRVLITGSLYLVGDCLKLLNKAPK